MKPVLRFIALFPEQKQVEVYLTSCRVALDMMAKSAYLANPPVPFTTVTAHCDQLEKDQKEARKRAAGAAQVRNVSLGVVRNDMRLLRAFVQSIADSNPADAEAIITGAGMRVAKRRERNKAPVAAKRGKAPGVVVLDAKALPQPVQYRWQMSTDMNTWTDLPETFLPSTTVSGLTAATVYYFRLRTMTHAGLSDWSTVVSVIVH